MGQLGLGCIFYFWRGGPCGGGVCVNSHVCGCACVCVGVHVMSTCRSLQLTSKSLSLSTLTEAASLVESRTQHFGYPSKPASSGIPRLCLLSTGNRARLPGPPSIYLGSGNLNSSSLAYATGISTTE
jgi:hypothetical protein